jgi:3-hydroxybutyryl-CoA dehydrogenase
MYFLCKKDRMQVLVIANDELEKELMAQPINESIQLQYVNAPGNNISLQNIIACIDLLFENDIRRINWLKQLNIPLVIINSVITPLSEINRAFIRINGWNTFLKRPITEASYTNKELKNSAEQLFQLLGRTIEWVPDIPGFITPRIVASVINEAFIALEEKVSDQEEIDIAMKSGTNYPYGPFEWAKMIGHSKIFELLTLLSKKQIRYRPSELLTQKAQQ